MDSIPLYYHPTQLVFVDDSRNFLDAIDITLAKKDFICTTFIDPFQAIDYINQKREDLQESFISSSSIPTDKQHTEFDISSIHKMLYQPKRFNTISTVIVDYDMPSINGLKLCEQLTYKDPSIILLTGEASQSLAIQAFNKKIIGQFISKSRKDLPIPLIKALDASKLDYFIRITQPIAKYIISNPNIRTFLENPHYISQFYDIIKELHIIEFYIISPEGDFLLIPKEGPPKLLFVQDEEKIQANKDDLYLQDPSLANTHLFCYHLKYGEPIDSIKNPQSYFYPKVAIPGSDLFYAISPAGSFLSKTEFLKFHDTRCE